MATIHGASTRAVETSEAMVSYRDVGSGPVLLLLHGGAPAATGWGNFGRNVADLAADFRVITPDQPGFGGSRLNSDSGLPYPVVSAQAMIELLDVLGIDRAHVVGNSKGAAVALQMALLKPDLVDRLVLVTPALEGFAPHVLAPEAEGERLLRDYYPDPTLERARHLVRSFVFDPDEIPNLEQVVEARYNATLDQQSEAGYLRMMTSTVADSDSRSAVEKVRSIENPTLLMWGRDDKFCNVEDAFAYLSALRNSELVVFRSTGHWLMFERCTEFAAHTKAFLSR
ncbi:alpha/beta fold hydrolase [Longivirga aurantiaca]|uniref:Alpha/beta fold hydrolase n=1 Tax=Longivirga aurantiaca TaxID=1837743 RepID=A0ABW1SWC4_9ACTN